jgi:hypothetical protein
VIGRQARKNVGKLLQHLRPAKLSTPKRWFDPRPGDVEGRSLEEDALVVAVRPESDNYLTVEPGFRARFPESESMSDTPRKVNREDLLDESRTCGERRRRPAPVAVESKSLVETS